MISDPLLQAIARWHEYYTLLGAASATMTGLLFVAASVASRTFDGRWRSAMRMFLSASIVHFASTLGISLTVLAPVGSCIVYALLFGVVGLIGIGYYIVAWQDSRRDGLLSRIAWDDRVWYIAFPIICYLLTVAAGCMIFIHLDAACYVLAAATFMLLMTGIHNAWDITIWSISRQQE